MCNPRRVMIHLARQVEEAWRRSVTQTATDEGAARELARVSADIPLDAEMGEPALDALEQVLRGEFPGFTPWEEQTDGTFRRPLGEVTLTFDPRTRCLTMETALTEWVTAEASAAAEASGFTVGEVAAEAMATWFDDGFAGRTEDRAREEARAAAEKRMNEAIEDLHRRRNPEAFAAAEESARKAAEANAAEALQSAQAEVRSAMRERMRQTLAAAEDQAFHVIHRAVGEAYRQTLLKLARDNGGTVIQDEAAGGVIQMTLEM